MFFLSFEQDSELMKHTFSFSFIEYLSFQYEWDIEFMIHVHSDYTHIQFEKSLKLKSHFDLDCACFIREECMFIINFIYKNVSKHFKSENYVSGWAQVRHHPAVQRDPHGLLLVRNWVMLNISMLNLLMGCHNWKNKII